MYNQGVTLFMHFDITFSFFSVFLFLLPYFWEHFPNQCLRGIDLCPGASLLVQWGRLCPSTIQVQVPSLVGELRFYMLHRVAKIIIVKKAEWVKPAILQQLRESLSDMQHLVKTWREQVNAL